MEQQRFFTKYTSIIYRLTNRYYDQTLAEYAVGAGQQFFLLRIHENPGVSMWDLARLGCFDKGTVTRGIQKLEEQGYVASEPDLQDKRIRRLFVTEKARPLLEQAYQYKRQWVEVLTRGFSQEEANMAEALLYRMADNAYTYMNLAGKESCNHVPTNGCSNTESLG